MPYVSNNGIRIYYDGVKGDGPSLVLQHGLSDSLPGWREYSIGFGLAQHVPERLISLTIGGSHPYQSDLTFFRQIFAEGLMAWLNLIEKMTGPLPLSTRERFPSEASYLASRNGDRPRPLAKPDDKGRAYMASVPSGRSQIDRPG